MSNDILFLIFIYYALDRLILEVATRKSPRLKAALPKGEHLRISQIALAAIILILFAYDSGKREALNTELVDVCSTNDSSGSDGILLQRVGDLSVCAKVDWEKKIVFADFTFQKIDAAKPTRFWRREFKPACIKAPPDAQSCAQAPNPADD